MSDTAEKLFEPIFKLLDQFESGVAKGQLTKPSEIRALLGSIATQTVILANRGGLPKRAKSLLDRLQDLCKATIAGLQKGAPPAEKLSFKEFLDVTEHKFGPIHTGLKRAVIGEEFTEEHTAQMREFNADTISSEEIKRLLAEYEPGSTKILGKQFTDDEVKELVIQFLHQFTPSQLRSISVEDLNQVSFLEIYQAIHGRHAAKDTSDLKRQLVTRHTNEMKQLSESYKHVSKKMPNSIRNDQAFTAFTYPVVPLFDDIAAMADPGKLERAGFNVTKVGQHFLVLEDQYILCVNADKAGVPSALRQSGGKTKSVNNSSALGVVLDKILDTINVRAPKKYALASQTIVRHPTNPALLLAWIIPEHNRQMLEKTLRTRKVDWDIPRHNMQAVKLSPERPVPARTK